MPKEKKEKKKYRHAIEVKNAEKSKVSKKELLRRIEEIENKLNQYSPKKENLNLGAEI